MLKACNILINYSQQLANLKHYGMIMNDSLARYGLNVNFDYIHVSIF